MVQFPSTPPPPDAPTIQRDAYEEDGAQDLMEVTDNKEVGLKRKLRSPLKENLMDVDAGKKQKIEGQVLVLSKLMAQQLGLAVATRQPRREQ